MHGIIGIHSLAAPENWSIIIAAVNACGRSKNEQLMHKTGISLASDADLLDLGKPQVIITEFRIKNGSMSSSCLPFTPARQHTSGSDKAPTRRHI